MTSNVRVVHPSDFLRARADGRIDLEVGKELLEEVAQAASSLENFHVLFDLRDSLGGLTPDDLHELAGSLARYRDTFLHKTAVLCPREGFDNARFFGLLAAGHGFRHIRAFLVYEDAMEWLMTVDAD